MGGHLMDAATRIEGKWYFFPSHLKSPLYVFFNTQALCCDLISPLLHQHIPVNQTHACKPYTLQNISIWSTAMVLITALILILVMPQWSIFFLLKAKKSHITHKRLTKFAARKPLVNDEKLLLLCSIFLLLSLTENCSLSFAELSKTNESHS